MKSVYFFLNVITLVLCQSTRFDIRQSDGEFSKLMTYSFDETIKHVIIFPPSKSLYPHRIEVWSADATVESPVLVVVNQEREVRSWEIPFEVETSKDNTKVYFPNTSRTMCHNNMDKITKTQKKFYSRILDELSQIFVVMLSTSSNNTINVFIRVSEEKNFFLENGDRLTISVSPSETRYYYYKFPEKSTTAVVKISSQDDVCLTVSVQDSYCPVFDLNKDITYEGKYQTINRKGGMSIRKKDFPDGFFLVFVAKADNYQCTERNSMLSSEIVTENRNSIVDFTVAEGIDDGDYEAASFIVLGAILGFCVVAVVITLVFKRWGTLSKYSNNTSSEDVDQQVIFTDEERLELLRMKELRVDLLARAPTRAKRKSYNYLWQILIIAVFYGIPVVQLVFTHQKVSHKTGNQDMCYYNFLCANPAWGLSDFNHIFSNVGYVIMGLLFLGVVLYRYKTLPSTDTGIPVHYGIFYAMGIALIIEGVLSSCYHVCPSQSNFQFDTSFMYTIAVLCMIKLYQSRHPDINAAAYATFAILGLTVFVAMIGILDGTLGVWIVFAIVYFILCTYISFKIYFISFLFDGFKQLWASWKSSNSIIEAIKPIKKSRFVLLLTANVINFAMLITGLCLSDVADFDTFLLGLLMGNAILYTIFYTIMKLVNGEKICFEAIIYGTLAIVTWVGSAVFFFDKATVWAVAPAESRQWNQECILLNFYDKHDIWHLLSAPALYLTFMFLMCLDDDIFGKKRTEITVF